jgi:hypothetical protein
MDRVTPSSHLSALILRLLIIHFISHESFAACSYITVMRECYEGYVLYNFLRLMIFYCGGDAGLLEWYFT